MGLTIEAACGCDIGKKRSNNEDNFCFGGKCLGPDDDGLQEPICMEVPLESGLCFAVFDGMGGEAFGEVASHRAAQQMLRSCRTWTDTLLPKRYLERLTAQLNDAVVEAQRERNTSRMGTTMAALYFSGGHAYACNVGDSRIFRSRNGGAMQISVDHVAERPGMEHRKAPLTQYLGIDPEEMRLEPHIFKGELVRGDIYLICSDGLTDMLTDWEISEILHESENADSCVRDLIRTALDNGGRDNITAIVCKLK